MPELLSFADAQRACRPVVSKLCALAAASDPPPKTRDWLSNREYMQVFTSVLHVSTQAVQHNGAAQMYGWFCAISDAWVRDNVVTALGAAVGTDALLQALRAQYVRHRHFARWLCSMFKYLDRFHTRQACADSVRCVAASSLQRAVLRAVTGREHGRALASACLAWLRVQWCQEHGSDRVPPSWLLDETLADLTRGPAPTWARVTTVRGALRELFPALRKLARGCAAAESPYVHWPVQLLCADVLGGLRDPFLREVVHWPDADEGPGLAAQRDELLRLVARNDAWPEESASLRTTLEFVLAPSRCTIPARPHLGSLAGAAHRALLARHLEIVGVALPAAAADLASPAAPCSAECEERRRCAAAAAAHRPFQLLLLATLMFRARDGTAAAAPLVGADVTLSCDVAELVRKALRAAPLGCLPSRVEFAWHDAGRAT